MGVQQVGSLGGGHRGQPRELSPPMRIAGDATEQRRRLPHPHAPAFGRRVRALAGHDTARVAVVVPMRSRTNRCDGTPHSLTQWRTVGRFMGRTWVVTTEGWLAVAGSD